MATRYDLKMQRRREAEAKEKRQKAIAKAVGILIVVAIVVAIAMIPINSYLAKNTTYITVGEHEVTKVEFDYYYNMAKNEYVNTYSSYLAYMGLDLSMDLAKQEYSEGVTWKDYFEERAVDKIKQNKALLDAAKAEGFSYDATKDLETYEETAKKNAKSSNMAIGDYYKQSYGRYASFNSLKAFVEEGYIAAAYYEELQERKAPTDDEITQYYNENSDDYDVVDYHYTEVAADIPADEEGNTDNASEEDIAKAMEVARENAKEAEKVIGEEGVVNVGKSRSSLVYEVADWLFEEGRTAGETTVIEDESNHKYYVVQFDDRYLSDTKTASVRVITTMTANGEDILAEYHANGANEDAFIALVDQYSDDTYSVSKGGLYEEITSGSLDSAVNDWIFASERKTGDTTSISEDGITYVLYYVEQGREEWKKSISDTLVNESMNTYMEEITNAIEVKDPKGHLNFMKEKPEESSEEVNDETVEEVNEETVEEVNEETAGETSEEVTE